MANLLPKKERKKIHKERMMRVTFVALGFLLLVVVISGALIVPGYILTLGKVNAVQTQLDATKEIINLQKDNEANVRIEELRARMMLLVEKKESISPIDLLDDVIRRLPNGVQISDFNFNGVGDVTMSLTGLATTREVLLAFQERLEDSVFFSNVHLPVSNLAQSQDISFTLTLIVNPDDITESDVTNNENEEK